MHSNAKPVSEWSDEEILQQTRELALEVKKRGHELSINNLTDNTTSMITYNVKDRPTGSLPPLDVPKSDKLVVEEDVLSAPTNYQPLPEIADLIKNLKILQESQGVAFHAPSSRQEIWTSLAKTVELLKNGEPFNPDPQPGSGQAGWRDTATMMSRNADFYHDIVKQVGEILGKEAYTSDDGSVQDSVLALKVPELVKALKERAEKAEQANLRV